MDRNYYLKIKGELPTISGVYTFRNKSGKPLYIGKANNLAKRVGSYFHGLKLLMIKKMLLTAHSISWEETISEIEALILESVSIKKFRPPFNTLMRDDKQYFYVGLTREEFPKLIITHQPSKLQNQIYPPQRFSSVFIGPFTSGSALKLALKTLRKIFPYCTCNQKHQNYCLNYHIGNCLGFCCLKSIDSSVKQKQQYLKNIQAITAILNGKKKNVLHQLLGELKKRQNSNDLESGPELHDKISKIKKFFANTEVIKRISDSNKLLRDLAKYLTLIHSPVRIEGYDISNIQGLFATGAMIVFTTGSPDKNEYRKFKIRSVASSNDTGMLREVIERRLKHREWQLPQLIVIDGGKGQVNAVSSVLNKLSLDIPVVGLIKNEKHFGERLLLGNQNKIIDLNTLPVGVKNLLLQIDSEAHRFAIQYYRKRHSLKK